MAEITLFELTQRLSEYIQPTAERVATGGNTTTLIDTQRTEGEDYFTNGTLWILSGTYAENSRQITGWDKTSKTFTFSALAGSIVAGVQYAAAPRDFPLEQLKQAISKVMRERLVLETDVSLTVADDTYVYTLPNGVRKVKRVEVVLDDGPQLNQHWVEVDGSLEFDLGYAPQDSGKVLRLIYGDEADDLVDDDDIMDARLDAQWVVWSAAVNALRWKLQKYEGDGDWYTQLLNEAMMKAGQLGASVGPKTIRKTPRLANW